VRSSDDRQQFVADVLNRGVDEGDVELLLGGVPGVVLGCLLARRVPANKLKTVVAVVAIFAGLQLVWSGSRTLVERRAASVARNITRAGVGHGR